MADSEPTDGTLGLALLMTLALALEVVDPGGMPEGVVADTPLLDGGCCCAGSPPSGLEGTDMSNMEELFSELAWLKRGEELMLLPVLQKVTASLSLCPPTSF